MDCKETPTEIRLGQEIQELNKQLKSAKKSRRWKCPHCAKATSVGKLPLEVVKFYVSPHGCTGGDYWTEGEDPDFHITCPKCEREVREYYCRSGGEARYALVKKYRNHFESTSIRHNRH